MRKIVLDSETTGLFVAKERMVSLGMLELFDDIPTDQKWEFFFKVPISMTPETIKITGITDEFLSDKNQFSYHMEEILDIIADSPIIAHNAQFDVDFLNKELKLCNRDPIKNHVIDTLKIARKIFPNTSNTLDALCKRFKIPNQHRKYHGALLDAELLSMVYYQLIFQQINICNPKVNREENIEFTGFPKREWPIDEKSHNELVKKYSFKD
jgi:DNA polymerase-3 subunit epsilon